MTFASTIICGEACRKVVVVPLLSVDTDKRVWRNLIGADRGNEVKEVFGQQMN